MKKVEPGALHASSLSSLFRPMADSDGGPFYDQVYLPFGDNPDGVAAYLEPLVQHARTHIPPSLEPETPLFLLATAGMRLLDRLQQAHVLNAACTYLRTTSTFRLEPESKDGPCGSSVQVITGKEEGLFGWIAVNYLMDGFIGGQGHKDDKTTYGFLDMGGASTQIAFGPAEEDVGDEAALVGAVEAVGRDGDQA